ncbi:MAG TPA: 6-bladed beta-propeller [Balneolaceae bacterium]|nr:6-bladed beta-propeller [Balneolaceae bacterium]
MQFISVLLVIILFTSCTQTKEELYIPDDLETIQINVEEAGILNMSDFIFDIEYIPLESPDGRPIGRIRKFLINDSYLGFYDEARKSVWGYTKDGEYVNEVIIPEGKGPGELENFEDVILTEQGEIHALGSFKIVVYDIRGNFIDETSFDFLIYNFEYISSTEEYVGSTENETMYGFLQNEHAGHNLFYFNKEGSITKSSLPILNGREEMGFKVPNRFPVLRDQKMFFPYLVDVIYKVTDSTVIPRYHLDYGINSIPEFVFDRRKNYSPVTEGRIEFFEEELVSNGYISFLEFFLETDLFIHLQISTGENRFTVIYNKQTEETKVGSGRLKNDIDYNYVPFFFESHDNALYTIIEANDLLRHLNEIYENEPEKYADPRMERLRELGYSLNDNSNPILQIASFKTEGLSDKVN